MSGGKVVAWVCFQPPGSADPEIYFQPDCPYPEPTADTGIWQPLVLQSDLAAAIARAEAVESALDHIARVGKSSRKQTQRTQWIVARAISALNGDDEWMSAMKPKGYHDALDRDAIAAQQAEGE